MILSIVFSNKGEIMIFNYKNMIDDFITTNKALAKKCDDFKWDNSSWGGGITFLAESRL